MLSPELTQEHSGDLYESLETPWSDHRCSWVFLVDFVKPSEILFLRSWVAVVALGSSLLVYEHAFRSVALRLISSCPLHRKLFYESPGGNQVDGLPPAANHNLGVTLKIGDSFSFNLCMHPTPNPQNHTMVSLKMEDTFSINLHMHPTS